MLRIQECKPGTLVECIDVFGAPSLRLGHLYTIHELLEPRRCWIGEWSVTIEEVCPSDKSFSLGHFRTLPERRLEPLRALLVFTKARAGRTPEPAC